MPVVEVQWPTTLPHNVLKSQFSYKKGSGMMRDTVDAGYPLIRRRYTATVDTYSISIVMTSAELEVFESFFVNSPGHSTLPGIFYGSVRLSFPEPLWAPGVGEDEDDRPYHQFRWVTDTGSQSYTVAPEGESQDVVVSFQLEKIL